MHQVMARSKHDAPTLDRTNTGCRPTMRPGSAGAHLHEYGGAICLLHDQVNFATTAAGRSIIAANEAQADALQVQHGGVFGGVTGVFGGGAGGFGTGRTF